MNCFVETCTSSNDEIRKLGAIGHPHGTWIAARTQTSGRGRLGRKWVSEQGNLFLSLLVRWPQKMTHWIPIAAGVWAAKCLRGLGAAVEIKWPNDLMVGGQKLGGILCEGEPRFVALGIGVNCASEPKDVRTPAISLKALGIICAPEYLAERLVSDFPAHFPESGVSELSLKREFTELSYLKPGAWVAWSDKGGHVEGLGTMGQLVVRDLQGKRLDLFAEEVR